MDLKAWKDWFLKNFLIIGLLTVITFGLICPGPGLRLDAIQIFGVKLGQIAIVLIFLVSGLCLASASEALKAKALTIGIILVLFVTPLMAIPILWLQRLDPTLNMRLLQGMALFCAVPTTLSSGVTMITQANGNVSLAILLTSVTNVLGVFTLSITSPMIFAAEVAISPWDMLNDLIVLTLVPLVVGMLLRYLLPSLREFATKSKKPLGISQNSCILLVVLLNISKAQGDILGAGSKDLSLCLALAAIVHLIYRVLGYLVAEAAALPPPEWVTIVLMCSQKSLPVCVSVMTALPPILQARAGVFTIPCICAHAAQLIIDSMLAVRWEVKDKTTWDLPPEVTPLLKP